jgi:hypothetical protein
MVSPHLKIVGVHVQQQSQFYIVVAMWSPTSRRSHRTSQIFADQPRSFGVAGGRGAVFAMMCPVPTAIEKKTLV